MAGDTKAVVVILKFNTETFELDVDAPDLSLDFVLSLVDRAQRILEEQVKIATGRQISQAVRTDAANVQRTEQVLSQVKL